MLERFAKVVTCVCKMRLIMSIQLMQPDHYVAQWLPQFCLHQSLLSNFAVSLCF